MKGAIYDTPIEHETRRITHIDNEKCFHFSEIIMDVLFVSKCANSIKLTVIN